MQIYHAIVDTQYKKAVRKLTQLTTLPLKQGKCAESSIISSLTTLKYYQNIIHTKWH